MLILYAIKSFDFSYNCFQKLLIKTILSVKTLITKALTIHSYDFFAKIYNLKANFKFKSKLQPYSKLDKCLEISGNKLFGICKKDRII